ncbi:molybdopterin-guanine dinucleotide biosynthesis protein B [Fictibacillus sp. Mic-4]|uniref:molybdopterin-guanine dinucleotide biosynthesis protein B n=1 Tax=Fictibacillus sp. Mic-4 TaxID=3132826 RepID=UPI003CF0873F
MAMGRMRTIQIIGYKNSGKTTLVSRLLSVLQKKGYEAGTLKHHGHAGPVKIGDEGTDTYKHREAGAVVTGVEGGGIFSFNSTKTLSITEMLHVYETLGLDFLLIEGFKEYQFPRVILLKSDDDFPLIDASRLPIAAIKWPNVTLEKEYRNIPQFSIDEKERYISYLVNDILLKVKR